MTGQRIGRGADDDASPRSSLEGVRAEVTADPDLEEHLERSQFALQFLRRRVAAVFFLLAVLTGGVFLICCRFSATFAAHGQFWTQEIWQSLVMLSLAGLADDGSFCRCILIVDLFLRATFIVIAVFAMRLFDSHPLLLHWMWVPIVVSGACVLWAVLPGSNARVQNRVWCSFRIQAVLSMTYELLCCVPYSMNKVEATEWCCLLPASLSVITAFSPWFRRVLNAKMCAWMRCRAGIQGAASIACLIGAGQPREVVGLARQRFKCVNFGKLDKSVLADHVPDPANNAIAEPCGLCSCDAFLSHSWHDDGDAKWLALQTWRAAFVGEHNREPVVWLDKCCVDQNSIDEDLRCLPVFLKGCSKLVVLCGPTYLSRLWCILEIFVYVHMGGEVADIVLLPLLGEDHESEDAQSLAGSFASFDAKNCQCFNVEDKQRILAMIGTAYGSMANFNDVVRAITSRFRCEQQKVGGGLV